MTPHLALALLLALQPAPRPPEPAPPEPAQPPQAQPDNEPNQTNEPDEEPDLASLLARWRPHLEALTPATPAAYFELGERIADRRLSAVELELARTLFVLAHELDRRSPKPDGWAAASLLALADLEPLARDRRWLIALAEQADPAPGRAPVRDAKPPPLEPAFLAATVLGLVRSGDGRAALRLLERPDVRRLLVSYERLLSPLGYAGGLAQLEAEARRWPCSSCGNTRFIRVAQPGGRVDTRLCPLCKGNPGPAISPEHAAAQWRFESRLLRGIHRSWSAQVIADAGVPLRDPDPDELAAVYRVDPAAVFFRQGRWTADPDAPPPQPSR